MPLGLHLEVSPKSVIVASSFKLSKWIRSELRQYGISVQVARAARDLGVCLNPGSRRFTAGIQAKRLVSAKSRLIRTGRLVRAIRGARKLVTTVSFPPGALGTCFAGYCPNCC